jgi:hypothetical protein
MVDVTLVQFSGSSWYAVYVDGELVEEETLGDLDIGSIFEQLVGEEIESFTHEFSTENLRDYGGFAPDDYTDLPPAEDVLEEY